MARRKVALKQPKDATPALSRQWDRVAHALLICLFLFGAVVRFANLDVVKRSPDEHTYTAQARAVLTGGVAGTRRVVETFLKTPSQWLFPPPNRIGYLLLVAAAMKVTGR